MIIINQVKSEIHFKKDKKLTFKEMLDDNDSLCKKAAKTLKISKNDIQSVQILKHSIDARKQPHIFQVYQLGVILKDTVLEFNTVANANNSNVMISGTVDYRFPNHGEELLSNSPVIVGMGPAGLFCGYMLALNGYKPIIIERGMDVDSRTTDVETFWNGGPLKPNSNVQFGEGGAGTFSDGKLNTLVKDKLGRNKEVLKIFVENGAPEEIMFESKPHIGTDILRKVVKNMREVILKSGGEVRFNTQMTSIEVENEAIKAIYVNGNERIDTSQVVLAIGHSARDTFEYLNSIQIPMEAKSFAVGLRVEHPQCLINENMYGSEKGNFLPAAPYKVTAKTSTGRGVYSFCMCPGGYVVNASSEYGRLAVNGMSYSDRASHNANSAIIVTVTPGDFEGDSPLSGVEFQRKLEEKAFDMGKGNVPVQYYGDYKDDIPSVMAGHVNRPCIKGPYHLTNLRGLLPDECETAFIEGMEHFEKIIKGFGSDESILVGVESRTSSPVRIHRDETFQCPTVKGLYPCGEGAGYAGGITSAAMDGMLMAEKIASVYKPLA